MIQNTKADKGGWRGDSLDIGYWGGDGTASVYWGMPGIDVSGVSPIDVMRAEFQYAMYNVSLSQAFGANRINIFGGIATPQAILKAQSVNPGAVNASPGTAPDQDGTMLEPSGTSSFPLGYRNFWAAQDTLLRRGRRQQQSMA